MVGSSGVAQTNIKPGLWSDLSIDNYGPKGRGPSNRFFLDRNLRCAGLEWQLFARPPAVPEQAGRVAMGRIGPARRGLGERPVICRVSDAGPDAGVGAGRRAGVRKPQGDETAGR